MKLYWCIPVIFVDTVLIRFVDTLSAVFIISSNIITESPIKLYKYLPFLQLHVAGFQIRFFLHMQCFFFILALQDLLLFQFYFVLHLLLGLHFYLLEISFVNLSDSFIPVITLKTFKFKSSVLFGKRTLLVRCLKSITASHIST